jgi:hypothetical protein
MFLLPIVLCVVHVATLGVIPDAAGAAVTVKNCKKLKNGMTRQQVIQLFRSAPIKRFDGRTDPPPMGYLGIKRVFLGEWRGSGIVVNVWFDENDKVSGAFWETPPGS